MANFMYNQAVHRIATGDLDLVNDSLSVILLRANSDVNAADSLVSVVLGRAGTTESTATGYTANGDSLAGAALSTTGYGTQFDATDLTFSALSAGSDIVACLIYEEIGGSSTTSFPICHIDGGFPVTLNGSDVTISWNSSGIIKIGSSS